MVRLFLFLLIRVSFCFLQTIILIQHPFVCSLFKVKQEKHIQTIRITNSNFILKGNLSRVVADVSKKKCERAREWSLFLFACRLPFSHSLFLVIVIMYFFLKRRRRRRRRRKKPEQKEMNKEQESRRGRKTRRLEKYLNKNIDIEIEKKKY